MLRNDIFQYLGCDPGDQVARELAKVRVIPAMQRALATGLQTKLVEATAEQVSLRDRHEKLDRFRVANSARLAGARSAAMRAVADVEAHRRETTRVGEMLESARKTRAAREREVAELDALIQQVDPVSVPASIDPLASMRNLLQERLDEIDAPILLDNAFVSLEADERIEMLSWLTERATRTQVVYIGDSSDLAEWSATADRVTVGRI